MVWHADLCVQMFGMKNEEYTPSAEELHELYREGTLYQVGDLVESL